MPRSAPPVLNTGASRKISSRSASNFAYSASRLIVVASLGANCNEAGDAKAFLLVLVLVEARDARTESARSLRAGDRYAGTAPDWIAAEVCSVAAGCRRVVCQRTVLEPSSGSLRSVYATDSSAPNLPSAKVLLTRNAPRGSLSSLRSL